MNPTNQFFIGGDSGLNDIQGLEDQIQKLVSLKNKMQGFGNTTSNSVWALIDNEINTLDNTQKDKLMSNEKYIEINNKLQSLVQAEILNIIIPRIESMEQGKQTLNEMLTVVKSIKSKIIKESNLEMELFSKFKEYSKNNPSLTYEEFLKNINS